MSNKKSESDFLDNLNQKSRNICAELTRHGKTRSWLAKQLEISVAALNYKLKGLKGNFTKSEEIAVKSILAIIKQTKEQTIMKQITVKMPSGQKHRCSTILEAVERTGCHYKNPSFQRFLAWATENNIEVDDVDSEGMPSKSEKGDKVPTKQTEAGSSEQEKQTPQQQSNGKASKVSLNN